MAIAQRYVAQQQTGRGGPSGLADVLEVLLDKGLVIDAFVRVSLVGIELLTVDARVVVASVDTYLRFAEAVNRLDLLQASNAQTLGDLVGGSSGRRERRAENGGGSNGSRRQELSAEAEGVEGGGREGPSGEREQSLEESSEGGLLSKIKQRGQAF